MPLVFVPTPLGNLRDMTFRATDALSECSLVVAEDSRVARKLLSALHLPGKEIWTYHEHNARSVTPGILERARANLVAVVTDAGTPGISDPGNALCAAARAAGIPIDVLPGPSALIGAAVLSGFDLRRFWFAGFPPRTSAARRTEFSRSVRAGETSVWYESPRRILATLADLNEAAPQTRVFLVREYTKKFEQQILGTAAEVCAALENPVRGEIAFVIEGGEALPDVSEPALRDKRIDELLDGSHSVAAIAKTLADEGFGDRKTIYTRASEQKRLRRETGKP